MIKVLVDRQKCLVRVEGHANFAPKGQDIVCSAVSILNATLLEYFKKYTEEAETDFIKMLKETFEDLKDVEDDDLKVKVIERNTPRISEIKFCPYHQMHFFAVNLFALGIELLVNEYPENVSLEIIEYKE